MRVHHSDTMKVLDKHTPYWETKPLQMASTSVLMIPFYSCETALDRAGDGVMKQGLCDFPT